MTIATTLVARLAAARRAGRSRGCCNELRVSWGATSPSSGRRQRAYCWASRRDAERRVSRTRRLLQLLHHEQLQLAIYTIQDSEDSFGIGKCVWM